MNEFEHKLREAEQMARKGHLSRRDFIQLAAAAGIAIPMASTMFSKAAQAQEPKKGGTLLGIGLARPAHLCRLHHDRGLARHHERPDRV
jgi:peptide/nickel transport system substrate-binding protein